jgi:hypothetical protein
MELPLAGQEAGMTGDLSRVTAFLSTLGASDGEYLHHVVQTLLQLHRNSLTDRLAILLSQAAAGAVPDSIVRFASAVQLVGVAGLAHRQTQGRASLVPPEQPDIDLPLVLLAGDYLYSQAAYITASLQNLTVMGLLAREITLQCRGEVARQQGEAAAGASGGLYQLCAAGVAYLLGCPGPLRGDLVAFGAALNQAETRSGSDANDMREFSALVRALPGDGVRPDLLALARGIQVTAAASWQPACALDAALAPMRER